VDLKKLDFSPGAKTKKLSVEKNETYAGESSAQFKATKPFAFQGVE
jgi:choloylglycine hydrolase